MTSVGASPGCATKSNCSGPQGERGVPPGQHTVGEPLHEAGTFRSPAASRPSASTASWATGVNAVYAQAVVVVVVDVAVIVVVEDAAEVVVVVAGVSDTMLATHALTASSMLVSSPVTAQLPENSAFVMASWNFASAADRHDESAAGSPAA